MSEGQDIQGDLIGYLLGTAEPETAARVERELVTPGSPTERFLNTTRAACQPGAIPKGLLQIPPDGEGADG